MDDRWQTVAHQGAEGECGTPLAAAAEPLWGTGAVGHRRARLAGRTRGETVPDRHDRRRHQPAVCAVRAARHNRGEHETSPELPGEVRTAAGILYGQGGYLSDGGEAQEG